jgi:hypothetical protein
MKRLPQIALTLAVILIGSTEVFPCSCADPGVREKFRAADSVFLGTLIEMIPTNPSEDFPLATNTVRFKVEKRWKGARKSEVTAVANYDRPGWCGDLNLTVGERYLIYADRVKGRLLIYADCGPNLNVRNAAQDMKRLNGFWFRLLARLYPYPAF